VTGPSFVRGRTPEPTTIHDQVVAAADRDPSALALVTEAGSTTYEELVHGGSAWASLLVRSGVTQGDVVAVRSGRALELPAALLGVLQSGACYTVIDPAWPAERQRHLLARTGARVCLDGTPDGTLAGLPGLQVLPLTVEPPQEQDRGPASAAARPVRPTDAACLFWTSGSTGVAKAVLSPHQATTRLFSPSSPLGGGPGTVMISVAAPAWDGFTLELWSMLTTGGCTVLHEPSFFLPNDLREAMRRHGVTDLFLTSGLFDVFVAEDVESFAGLSRVSVGGDRLSQAHAGRFLAAHPGVALTNGYGPVECCGFVTTRRVDDADLDRPEGAAVGKPVPGTDVLVVDEGEVVPRGRDGEIWIGGQAVGLGYLDDDLERTREAFIESGGCRYYRTGDRGRITDDGVLLFLGRTDRQVKIAGHRVEPAETESAALRLGCSHAVAVPVPTESSPRGLALFAVPGSFEGRPRDLRAGLAEVLPPQLVPWPVRFVQQLPLTTNGKVDRDVLRRQLPD